MSEAEKLYHLYWYGGSTKGNIFISKHETSEEAEKERLNLDDWRKSSAYIEKQKVYAPLSDFELIKFNEMMKMIIGYADSKCTLKPRYKKFHILEIVERLQEEFPNLVI